MQNTVPNLWGDGPKTLSQTGLSFADLSRRFVPDGSDNRAVQLLSIGLMVFAISDINERDKLSREKNTVKR
jgi:hypothetical protein